MLISKFRPDLAVAGRISSTLRAVAGVKLLGPRKLSVAMLKR